MSSRPPAAAELAEQFEDLEKQAHAARLGVWLFLGSEILLFAGLFALYAAYRVMYGAEFVAASAHNDATLGTANTFVLITSSFTVAMAIHAARTERPRLTLWLLLCTLLLASVFLVIKGTEYAQHFHEGIYPGTWYRFAELPTSGARTFFTIYFFLSGLHAIHVVIGMSLLAMLVVLHLRRPYGPSYYLPLELGGLYWHLVDLVWIFLWPLLYLAR